MDNRIVAKKHQSKYWDIKPIKSIPSQYKLIYGERSNGKTYGTLLHAIEEYFTNGNQFAYVRRWADDIRASNMKDLFTSMVQNGEVERLSLGDWNGIAYKNGCFYAIATDLEENMTMCETPMGYVFAISAMEHKKSLSYPGIKNIVFDEFISRRGYIPDEFGLFMNVLSTVIRDRDDVTVWMLGNTVSKDCPYFREMGLRHIDKQKPGTIDTYSYEKAGQQMLIAVEYTENLASKKSDKYFIFDNPKMAMITGGAWEFAIYPHLFEKYKPTQILFNFFILYRQTTLHCEIIDGKYGMFIYCHEKTTPIQKPDDDLIYSTEPTAKPNWKVNIMKPYYNIEKKIGTLISQERMCFQDNEVGEVFNDYLKWCRSHSTIKN